MVLVVGRDLAWLGSMWLRWQLLHRWRVVLVALLLLCAPGAAYARCYDPGYVTGKSHDDLFIKSSSGYGFEISRWSTFETTMWMIMDDLVYCEQGFDKKLCNLDDDDSCAEVVKVYQ